MDGACFLDGGGGGGGSGGTLWIQAAELVLEGSLQARGAPGGSVPGCDDGVTGGTGGTGAAGRIRLDVGSRRGGGSSDPAPGLVTPGC